MPPGETALPLLPSLGGTWPQAGEFFFEGPSFGVALVCVRLVGASPDPCAAARDKAALSAAAAPKPRPGGALLWRGAAFFDGPAARWEAVFFTASAATFVAWGEPAAEGVAAAAAALGATPLPLGSPILDSVGWDAWKYYELNITNVDLRAASRLDISVVRTWGDPDLFVSLTGALPTSAQGGAQYSSASVGASDQVVIAWPDVAVARYCAPRGDGGTCQFLVGVVGGLLGGAYRITASLGNASAELANGVPFPDTIMQPGGYNFYFYRAQAPPVSRLTFSLTPTSGDPDLFVGNKQQNPVGSNPASYCWVSSGVGGGAVEVQPSDPCYCTAQPCVYYLGVQAAGASGSSYALMVTEAYPGSNASLLVDGQPEMGALARGEIAQYTLTLPPLRPQAARPRVGVTVTPFWGDPDLYIAFAPTVPGPGASNAYVSFNADGPEDIVMRDTDPQWNCSSTATPCVINIGIYGFSNTLYQLEATAGRPSALSPGVPQLGDVDASPPSGSRYYTYFTFQPANVPNEVVIISLTPTLGDPDMYVATSAGQPGVLPTSATGAHFWASAGLGDEVVAVDTANDPRACPRTGSSPPCVYTIGVMGFNRGAASFSISARTRDGTPVRLVPGVPVEGAVDANAYDRYTVQFDRRLGYLEVTVSPMSGDPDLYVSLGALPNRTIAQYASTAASGDEDIMILPTDPAFVAACPNQALPCVANIAVFGFPSMASAAPAQYAITASDGLRVLANGAATVGRAPNGKLVYFLFEVAGGAALTPISIALAPLCAGGCDPDLYVSKRTANESVPTGGEGGGNFSSSSRMIFSIDLTSLPPPSSYHLFLPQVSAFSRPNTTSFLWRSTNPGTDILTIASSDPNLNRACPLTNMPCRLYIGVYAWGTVNARFSISATSSGVTALTLGQPAYAAAPLGSFVYFSFYLPAGLLPSSGLEFTVEPRAGAADAVLYVGNARDPTSGRTVWPSKRCTKPDCSTYTIAGATWTSASSLSRREVFIPRGDPNLRAATQYVAGVLSPLGGASVGVTVTYGSSWTSLSPGIPVQGDVPRDAYRYFRLVLNAPVGNVTVTVTPILGDPDLFVSVDPVSPGSRPNKTNCDAPKCKFANGLGTDTVTFQWLEMPACVDAVTSGGSCGVWVGVYGYTNASFSVVAVVGTGAWEAVELLDGVPQGGSLTRGAATFFFADVDVSPDTTYSFYVHPLSGDADLYVTTNRSIPSTSNFQYKSTSAFGDDFVNVVPGDSGYNSSTRAFAMVLGYTDTAFDITFSTSSAVVPLADGVASSGAAASGRYLYYSFSLANPAAPLPVTLALTARSGDPDVYVSVWDPAFPNFRPTAQVHTWQGTSFGSDTVSIAPYPTDPGACQANPAWAAAGCAYIVGVKCDEASGNCRFSLTASAAGPDSALIPLVDGQPQSNAVPAPGSTTFFSFSSLGRSGNDQDVTISLSVTQGGGALRLYVTSAYSPTDARTRPGPSFFNWTDSFTPGTVFVSASSARGATFLVIGVYWPPGGGGPGPAVAVDFSISATSSQAVFGLSSGQPSPQRMLPAGGVNRFFAVQTALGSDLLFSATLLSGTVTIVVSPSDPTVNCTAPRACSASAVWWSMNGPRAGNTVRVYNPGTLVPGLGPCEGPYRNSAASCDATSAWHTGSYYVAVYGITDAVYTLTYTSYSPYTQLADGVPAAGAVVAGAPPVFAYSAGADLSLPDVRFILSVDASSGGAGDGNAPLLYFMNSCVDSACTASDISPRPGAARATGVAARGADLDFFLTKFSPAYCQPPPNAPNSRCVYFIALFPSREGECAAGTPGACTFRVTAQVQSGRGRTSLPFASINGSVATLLGNIPPGGGSTVELYLDDVAARADITITLQACGPGYPTLYVCNPAAPVRCTEPAQPGPAGGSSLQPAGTAPGGVAVLRDYGVNGTPAYFIGVAATAPPAPAAVGNWQYQLQVSSGPAWYLAPPTSPALAVAPTPEGGAFNVSWMPAALQDQEGRPARVAPVGVTYFVYAAKGGFAAGESGGAVPTTACGLGRWSVSPAGAQPQAALAPDVTSALVSGLAPGVAYDLNVVAMCDRSCWTATLRALGAAGAPAEAAWAERALLALGEGGAAAARALQPGYVTQRVAYAPASATSGGGGGEPTSVAGGLGAAGVAGLVFGAALLLGGGYLGVRYWRGRADDHYAQYSNFDVPETQAMATISVPSFLGGGGGGGSGGSIQAPGGGELSSRLSSLRSLFSSASARGYKRAPLADTADHSELDDRVTGFL